MAIQIQLRRGTAAAWTTANPILAQGEPGVETDTLKWKVGDGSTHWISLPYANIPSAPTYGTTLPASPADGQEAVLVDSVTNPTYQWRFRYNAGSTSAYKWEFVGGAPKSVGPGNMQVSVTTATVITGMTWTIVRSGEYRVESGAFIGNHGGFTGPYGAYAIPYANGASLGGGSEFDPTAGYAGSTVSAFPGLAALVAGQVLDLRSWNSIAGVTTTIG